MTLTLLGAFAAATASCSSDSKTPSPGPANDTGGKAANTGGSGATSGGSTAGGSANSGGTRTGGSPGNGGTPQTGGTRTGGSPGSGGTQQTGGARTGGTGPAQAVCTNVATLPTQYTQCSNLGESQCRNGATNQRCVCARNVWYCNNACPATAPTADADCSNNRGAACTYAGGAACGCVSNRWVCLGTASQCPDGSTITTGDDCTGRVGLACDYPNADPLLHKACACLRPAADAGTTTPGWNCFLSARCPATQPTYPTACGNGAALCNYGTINCACMAAGNWICL